MHDSACIFCKIAAQAVPAKEVYRDDDVVAVVDVTPQAPHHLLVMPVAHHPNVSSFVEAVDADAVAKLFRVAARIGAEYTRGFRLVVNEGQQGGQTVQHLHVHVLAGRHMEWPPG